MASGYTQFIVQECRWLIRVVGFYLIPWAKVCDGVAALAAKRWARLQPYTWHLAACLLCLVITCHFAAFYSYTDAWGFGAPCVCEASVCNAGCRHISLSFSSGSCVRSLVTSVRACIFACSALMSALLDLCHFMLVRPLSTCVITISLVLSRQQ
jgi:hypothetical protein